MCVERGSENQGWPTSEDGTLLSIPTTGTPPRVNPFWGSQLLLKDKRMKVDTDQCPVPQQLPPPGFL